MRLVAKILAVLFTVIFMAFEAEIWVLVKLVGAAGGEHLTFIVKPDYERPTLGHR